MFDDGLAAGPNIEVSVMRAGDADVRGPRGMNGGKVHDVHDSVHDKHS